MIICPNCHHDELPGSLFCSECGAQLVVSETPTTQHIQRSPSDILAIKPPLSSPPNSQQSSNSPAAAPEIVVSLHMVDNGQIYNLSDQTEFTIGRTAEGQPILPDVDLSAFEAYAQGVSRLHAALKIHNQRVVITDLGSSNGTRVNGQKIVPHVDYPLNHGDMIALGKFAIQVLIKK
jgi:pSer/pThr/pTyr-binding forkhead associated (FHA) protein